MEFKKVFFLLGMSILLITGIAFAQYNPLNFFGSITTHRTQISADDTTDPTDITDAVNTKGYSHIKIYWWMNENTASWDITPMFWNEQISYYNYEKPIHIMNESSGAAGESSGAIIIPSDQAVYTYIKVNNGTGVSPLITIRLQGVNRL